ncbi:MAG: hypothetical protein HC855_00655 [Rhizobiales bacterium]|nr:hypothetical protein [Hyphomicrobiales bacterium]
MDWDLAMTRNRDALLRIVASLFAMLGLVEGAAIDRIPRALHTAVLRILRPAEAAVRRLIVAAARGMVVKPAVPRQMPRGEIVRKGSGKTRRPAFRLEDIRPPLLPPEPRPKHALKSFSPADLTPAMLRALHRKSRDLIATSKPAPIKDGKVNASSLAHRLQAIKGALDDLSGQARRFLRWKAKRERISKERLIYTNPIRPGPPPYVHKKARHEVEEVLRDCHWLAWEARNLDTS